MGYCKTLQKIYQPEIVIRGGDYDCSYLTTTGYLKRMTFSVKAYSYDRVILRLNEYLLFRYKLDKANGKFL